MFFQERIKLKNLGSFKIGGEAKFFKEARDTDDLIESVAEANLRSLPFFILGGGTNILWSDKGFDGLILKPSIKNLTIEGEEIKAGAGVLMSELIDFAVLHGLSGLEWAGGLPGTFGGAIRGNAGAFGGEIKDVIKEVVSLNTSTVNTIKRSDAECVFGYRTSIFKEGVKEIIVEAKLKLSRGNVNAIKSAVQDKINYRHERYPMEYPNVGSIFKNVAISKFPKLDLERFTNVIKQDPFPVIPTAFLISEAGLKGVSYGGAMISPKHPNFIVNVLGATSKDVKNLIELVKDEVLDKFGVGLEEEIQILSENPS